MKFHYDPPKIIKLIFSNFLWNTKNGEILLTFDDGPNPGTTEKLLELLKVNNIKALFFCLGENVSKYPELCRKIIDDGHTIGNHTFSHKKFSEVSKNEIIEEIKKINSLLSEKFNYQIKYFRPPYGRFNFATSKIMKEMNLVNVMWSLLTYDFEGKIEIVKMAVTKYLKNNSIVVFHDSNKTKNLLLDSVKFLIDEVEKNKYKFGEPENCLK